MKQRYFSMALAGCAMAHAWGQGDTCTTALPVIAGIHLANGPDSGSPGPCGFAQDGDWYMYTPSFTGTITITSCHPLNAAVNEDTFLEVMSGNCADLECIDSDDDGSGLCSDNYYASFLELNVVEGENYYIVWTDRFDDDPFYWALNECVGTVTGVTFDDNNDNGTRDTGEGQLDMMLLVQPGEQYVFAGQDPYSFCSESGAYTITVPTPPLYHSAVPTSRSFEITAQGQQVTGADFAFQSIPGIHDASVNLFGWNPWIGNNTALHINYANIGTEPLNATVTLDLDPLTSFIGATPVANMVAGQTITWELGSLEEGASGTIHITIHTASTAAPNAPVMQSVNLSTSVSDFSATNNVDELHGFCTSSFDPNDKAVDRSAISPSEVSEQEKLEYTVRFQNTGNAPAVNVVIRDMLDQDLDLSTFEMIGATHPYTLSIVNNEAMWTFEQIMLPDSSTDQLGSQGALHYRVAPKADLVIGDVLSNRADIYFDYNEPVLTNTVETVVAPRTDLIETDEPHLLTVHPSPSDGHVTLRLGGPVGERVDITIMDALGRTVSVLSDQRMDVSRGLNLDLSGIGKGTYLAWVRSGSFDARTRLIIQ